MSFLLRGRSPWWRHDQAHPAPEPVPAAAGLPVAAQAPEGGTDDLRAARLCDRIIAHLGEAWPHLAEDPVHLDQIAEEAMTVIRPELEQLLAHLPPDGQGRWRQGTKNPRNLYVHQGDDEVGQPVGQMYSAELAALVCDAVNAQQARGEA